MKIIVAPDSFKGSLSAVQACSAIEAGILSVYPEAQVIKLPIADGGEGTVDAFAAAMPCRLLTKKVAGPLGKGVDAVFAVLGDHTAVIEMAAASGLPLLKEREKDPLETTTYGTGELIKAALDEGCKKIIIGLGGSATNDGGSGMAQALGFSLTDSAGNELGWGGGELRKLARIDSSGMDKRLLQCEIIAACDVNNPLCGENGASAVFGPQKGADEAKVRLLDEGLKHFASVILRDLGMDILQLCGGGAAGGLAAGLFAFCNARIEPGIELILDAVGFDRRLEGADLVITGEGKIDFQSAFGKVPAGVAKHAGNKGVPVLAFAGSIGTEAENMYNFGVNAIAGIVDKPMTLEKAMENAGDLLKNAVERAMRLIKTGQNIKCNS